MQYAYIRLAALQLWLEGIDVEVGTLLLPVAIATRKEKKGRDCTMS